MTARPILFDCDPGVDDAVALFLAFSTRDELDVLGVTTVAGNVPLALTSRNARIIRELAGREEIPVHAGRSQPLIREQVTAEDFHGATGLAGIETFEPAAPLDGSDGPRFLIERLRAADAPVTLVVTGPMTNIAAALTAAPDIKDHILELVMMGGAHTAGGNITPRAEFNVFADPHAAEQVLRSGVPIVVISLDITHQVRATAERIAMIEVVGTRYAAHTAALLTAANALESRANGAISAPLHDPCTVAYLLAPDLFSGTKTAVTVDIEAGDGFGQTRLSADKDGSVRWLDMVDADGVFALIAARLGAAP